VNVTKVKESAMLEYYRFKTAAELFRQGKHKEGRQELLELQQRYIALCDEVTTLKVRLLAYEELLYLSQNLAFDGAFYWLLTGSVSQGPFCPRCYEAEGLLIRLSTKEGERLCGVCGERWPIGEEVAQASLALASSDGHRPPGLAVDATNKRRPMKAKILPFVR
jgi:hypothetical protein